MIKTEVCSRNVCIKTEATGKSERTIANVTALLLVLLLVGTLYGFTNLIEGVSKKLIS